MLKRRIITILAAGLCLMGKPSAKSLLDSIPSLLRVADSPRRSELIIVFGGGGGRRIQYAARLLEQGYGKRILFLGTKAENRFAQSILKKWYPERAGEFIYASRGLSNTSQGAVFAADYLSLMNTRNAIIVSDGWHLRRIRLMMNHSDKASRTDIAYCPVPGKDLSHWWVEAGKRRNVAFECVKLARCAILCCV